MTHKAQDLLFLVDRYISLEEAGCLRGMRSLGSHCNVLGHRLHPGYRWGRCWSGRPQAELSTGMALLFRVHTVDPEIRLDGVWFLQVHSKKEKKQATWEDQICLVSGYFLLFGFCIDLFFICLFVLF